MPIGALTPFPFGVTLKGLGVNPREGGVTLKGLGSHFWSQFWESALSF